MVRLLRVLITLVILATSGLVPGLPTVLVSICEAGIAHLVNSNEAAAEHDDDCASKDADGDCEGCPIACARCACATPRAVGVEPTLPAAPSVQPELIMTPCRLLRTQASINSIFHPPRP